jgi:quinol monooxygenase YgiN
MRSGHLIIVIGSAKPKPGMEKAFVELAKQAAIDSRLDEGCIQFNFAKDLNDGSILGIEIWESQDAIDAHMKQSATMHFLEKIGPMFDGEPVMKYIEVPN